MERNFLIWIPAWLLRKGYYVESEHEINRETERNIELFEEPTANAKKVPHVYYLVPAEINSLAKENGQVFVGDEHFVGLFHIDKRTVRRIMKFWEDAGMIERSIEHERYGKKGTWRTIHITYNLFKRDGTQSVSEGLGLTRPKGSDTGVLTKENTLNSIHNNKQRVCFFDDNLTLEKSNKLPQENMPGATTGQDIFVDKGNEHFDKAHELLSSYPRTAKNHARAVKRVAALLDKVNFKFLEVAVEEYRIEVRSENPKHDHITWPEVFFKPDGDWKIYAQNYLGREIRSKKALIQYIEKSSYGFDPIETPQERMEIIKQYYLPDGDKWVLKDPPLLQRVKNTLDYYDNTQELKKYEKALARLE